MVADGHSQCESMGSREKKNQERVDHHFFLVTTVQNHPPLPRYPGASYGFFGGKISWCARTNLLQMVPNLRLHPRPPF